MHKIVFASGHCKSAALAAGLLQELAEFSISPQHVSELTLAIGSELTAQRDRQVAALPPASVRDQRPGEVPAAVAVEVDGGRLQTRAVGHGRGVHDPHWNENKIACLVTMESEPSATDPQAELPSSFLDRQRVQRLVQEISNHRTGNPADGNEEVLVLPAWAQPTATVPNARGGASGITATGPEELAAASGEETPPPGKPSDWRPQRLVRTCVATMAASDTFGKQVANEAYQRNFYQAPRRAYVGDGQKYNWKIQERQFADFEAIADFVHVLTYVYAAALAVAGSVTKGWPLYLNWIRACWQGRVQIRACWQGRVQDVLGELTAWQQRQETPPAKPPPTDPREIVRTTVTYLTNNAPRMNYPWYRQRGLPCMSSWMEALVKEFNYRVKGSEKFWNRGTNAEAILQVRAAVLSEDNRLWQHIQDRGGSACRPYRRKKAKEE